MADPALGLQELLQGDPSAYIRQNNRNLVVARMLAPVLETASPQTSVPSADRGDMFLVGSPSTTYSGTVWDGAAVDDIAIALSDNPSSAEGWAIITPVKGMRVHDGTSVLNYLTSWT